ncbi:MAG: sulfurtransferase complex subunit TusB [Colwellia sp.]
MSTLHLVRQSAFVTNDFAQCLHVLGQQDGLVLMDDGCYNLSHTLMQSLIQQENNTVSLNIMTSHAHARAIMPLKEVQLIDIAELVDLTFTYGTVITWQ